MPRIALAQMLVVPGEKEQNLARAVIRIAQAAAQGAQAVILPEALDAGWTDPSSQQIAEAIPSGSTFQKLSQAAATHQIFVTAGITERAGSRLFNAAVLISPSGELLLNHRKINELDLGHEVYALGDKIQVCDSSLGRIGLMICADGFARQQVITRSLCYMGAEMIFSPCAWAVPADHDNLLEPYGQLWLDNYSPVAAGFQTWIFGVSNVGPITAGTWKGRKCIGSSLAIDPRGREVARGPYGERAEELMFVEAHPAPRPARGTDWESILPA